jgi:hypothetical protein
MRRAAFATISLSLLLYPMLSGAVRFPDVPGDHPYNSSVEALAIEGVVTGNPDGNFYPARPVNRAEFLTMLYRANKKTATAVSVSCFSDVKASEWYANVVCDAVAEGFVNGYPDGAFRPEQSVNRVEALKMLYKVFGLGILTGDDADLSSEDFTDIQAGAWYTTFVSSSYRNGLLPVAGYQSSGKFYPTNPLLRGEAAAYIWRAMNITGDFEPSYTSSSSDSSESSESSASSTSTSASSRSVAQRSSQQAGGTKTLQVDFPFTDEGDVNGVENFVYAFPLTSSADVDIEVKLGTGKESGVSCRLYLLGTESISDEYYLGYQSESTCKIRASVPAGKFQLEVRPEDGDATFEVFTKLTKGDGNDGFNEAKTLLPSKPTPGQLPVSDIADWYKLTVGIKGMHTVQLFGDDVGCSIYPTADVDLVGFSSPVCGEEFEYAKGTYMVRVQRHDGVDASLTYTVQLD